MSKSALDLSKFKKITGDDKTSTFRHFQGHELTIAHSKLTKKMREQIASLPVASKKESGTEPVQKFAEGGVVNAPNSSPSQVSPDDPNFLASMGAAPQSGIPMAAEQAASPVPEPSPSPMMPVTSSQMGMASHAPPESAMMGSPSDPYGMMANSQAQLGALGEQKQGLQMVEQAKGAMGANQAKQEEAFQKNAMSTQDHYNVANDALTKERQSLQNDIANQHIDPKHYINNMSTGGKIATGIGLILGGAGAGLTHGPNMAFQYLQSQIDHDIDAQKSELGKKNNLLSHNLQATGDLRAATELTRIQSNDILSSHLRQEAGKAATQAAAGAMLNVAGTIDAQSAQIQHNLAVQKAMLGGGGEMEDQFKKQTQYLRMNGQEAMAKDMEAKHVPGVGQASKEVPADIMNQLTARQDLQNKIQNVRAWAQKNQGALNPATVAYGHALAAQVQDAYRRANGQGVFKESEADFVKGIVADNPTAFFNKLRVDPKYKALQDDNGSTLNHLKQSYGLPVQSGESQQPRPPQEYIDWAKKNPTDPRAQKLLAALGGK